MSTYTPEQKSARIRSLVGKIGARVRQSLAGRKYRNEDERRAAKLMSDQRRANETRNRRRERRESFGLKNHRVTRDPIPSEVIADRDATPPPQTITAAFCGDPPPGRSALDKRKSTIRP